MSSTSPRPRIVSIATVISLFLLLSITYHATLLPGLPFSEHLFDDATVRHPLKTAVIIESRQPANLDFIGAPIDPKIGKGMNGGLSLRNRERVIEVLGRSKFLGDWSTGDGADEFEDQWVGREMGKLPPRPNSEPGANIPSHEIAETFSVETLWHSQAFGLHQVSRWQPNHLEELAAWCPEYLLAGLSRKYCSSPRPDKRFPISSSRFRSATGNSLREGFQPARLILPGRFSFPPQKLNNEVGAHDK
ncbi:MAG: hypothetical protein Q9210_001086 [Variospora velana]